MNRTIKFRGKYKQGNMWLTGFFCMRGGHSYITVSDGYKNEVKPETVGQFTGMNDAYGREIYEGDVVEHKGRRFLVVFFRGMFYASSHECQPDLYGGFPLWSLTHDHEDKDGNPTPVSVVGNRWDSPELLKTQEPGVPYDMEETK